MTGDVKSFDRTNAIVAAGVFVATLIVYLATMAPTLSFWDCGEFITVGTTLGIPHPPGTPLWVVIARVFAILPFFSDPAVRINFLSALSSALCAMFGYLIAVRLARPWFSDGASWFDKLLLYGGSAAGAFFLAFGLTQWNNAVEAEVYGVALMLMAIIFWLALIYVEHQGTPLAWKVMILAILLAFLGVGVHMTVFLVFPVIAIPFVLKKSAKAGHWFAIGAFFVWELYLIFVLSSREGEVSFTIPVLVAASLYLFTALSSDKMHNVYWLTLGWFALSMLPLGAELVNSVLLSTGNTAVFSSGTIDTLSTVSIVCFVGLILFGTWLLVRWKSLQTSDEDYRMAHLISAAFILGAGLFAGVLYLIKGYPAFLMLTVLSLAGLGIYMWRHIHIPVLVGIVGSALVIVGVEKFWTGLAVAAIVILLLGLTGRFPGWRLGLCIVAVAAVGWSAHLYLPIRSSLQPVYNQSDPAESYKAFIDFIERKQYGQKSMTERMFTRRAEWTHQFGTYQRMGFWGFFREQYGISGVRFVVVFLVGLFAVWEIIRRNVFEGVPFFVLLLICSVGLVLYMNFADGTRIDPLTGDDYLEVRDRDYFWTPFFVYFGLAIGMGLALVIKLLTDSVQSFSALPRRVVSVASLVLLITPGFALARNYHYADRSGNYIPHDYAWNLLQTCQPNAICFTQGDNDTYPLWCLQQVYHVREDVKIVNLSLANTQWYIRQLQSTLCLKLGWTDDQIRQMGATRNPDGSVTRLQTRVVDQVLATQLGTYPINFAVTCSNDARKFHGQSLETRTSLMGLQWRIGDVGADMRIDYEEAYAFFMDSSRFQLRSCSDDNVYKDDNTKQLVRNVASAMLVVADTLRRSNDFDRAERISERALEVVPFANDVPGFLGALYAQQQKSDKLAALIDKSEGTSRFGLRNIRAQMMMSSGDTTAAIAELKDILAFDPNNSLAFEALMRIYYVRHQLDLITSSLEVWLANNPNDRRSAGLLKLIRDGKDIWDPSLQ